MFRFDVNLLTVAANANVFLAMWVSLSSSSSSNVARSSHSSLDCEDAISSLLSRRASAVLTVIVIVVVSGSGVTRTPTSSVAINNMSNTSSFTSSRLPVSL